MADFGYVYCLGNGCMPGIYKIGKTERSVMKRAQELSSSTSVPVSFHVLFYVETDSMSDLELMIHKDLDDHRVSRNREFFECDPRLIREKFNEHGDISAPSSTTGEWEALLEELEIDDHFMGQRLKEMDDGQDQDSQA